MRFASVDLDVRHRQPVRFTPEEFYTLAEQGLIPQFTELVEGEIIEMPGQYYLAVAVINEIHAALRQWWHDKRCVVSHLTHPFVSGWNPMPDVAVYDERPPKHPRLGPFPPPRLVVEVSDSTLAYDLGEKATRYANEGLEELWVADAEGRVLHVFREATDGHWRTQLELKPGDTITPLCLPSQAFAVSDLLPE